MGVCIAVTSGKGGVGKSTLCINMGIVLASQGYRVCLIDVDLGLKNLDIMMGLENRVYYDLMDVMKGRCPLNKALIKDKRCSDLYLLPACKSVNVQTFDGKDLCVVVDELKQCFDYILLDTPAGIESGFHHALMCAQQVILVSTLDVASLQDADRVIGLLYKEGINKISCVMNRVNPHHIEKGYSVKLEEALAWLSVDLLGVVYDDELIIRGNNRGLPAVLNQMSNTYECMKALVLRLLGNDVPIPKFKEKTLLQRIFS